MNLVDRHIIREWLIAFALALGVILGILLLFDISDNLKDLIDFDAGAGGILRYYLTFTLTLIPAVLPIALMVSILFSLGVLHRNNEIIALRAAGLSLWRITRSLWLVGVALTLGLFYLNAHLVPWAVEETHAMMEQYSERHQATASTAAVALRSEPLSFYNDVAHRLWYINAYDKHTRKGLGVTVSQLDARQREITRIYANSASYDPLRQRWTFYNGREDGVDSDAEDPAAIADTYSLDRFTVRTYAFSEDPVIMRTLEKRPKDLSFNELSTLLIQMPTDSVPQMRAYEVHYHRILANPVACLIVVGLAIPFAVAGVRTNPMVGICKAIALFALYYVVSSLSSLVGSRGLLPPALAAWVPNLLMLLTALYFSRKAV
ncbi:MAG: LptF/LptG family permease [Verrucomicrobiota bacterium]|nr:LptF/LptG family permease [Verrucomicrobiota bacterium]